MDKLTTIFQRDPYAQLLRMELVRCEPGYAMTRVTITDDMLNFNGTANGGLIFSLADYAFAAASNAYGQTAVGIHTHMSYHAAGKVGDVLTCAAHEVKRSRRLAVYDMRTINAKGELVSTMEGTVYIKNERVTGET